MISKKFMTKKAQASYLEITLIILSIFAFSYLIGGNIKEIDAQEAGFACCEQTKSGAICEYNVSSECDTNYKMTPTECEATDYCHPGCCFSTNTGYCDLRAVQRGCEEGKWSGDEFCRIQECQEGCCVLGDQTEFVTERTCEVLSGGEFFKDIPMDFRPDITSEVECRFITDSDKKGACIIETDEVRDCIYMSFEECYSRTYDRGSFFEGTFCSNPELKTNCTAKDHKGCLGGIEDVYWFDSCNNPEDIADDCSIFDGTFCGVENNKAICKDIDCIVDGTKRKNGESWCEYDGKIGDGKDPAGSRHFRHVCYMGEERLEPCSDFRNELCVQEDTILEDGDDFSQAACRVNRWRTCLNYNRDKGTEKMKSNCEKNPDCHIKHIDMGGSFAFDVCLPAYPPGFELTNEMEEMEDYAVTQADGICSTATIRCTETWKCGIFGCICKDNCKCHTGTFTNEMNDFCISLGDCGAYINYIGEWSDTGYSVRVVQKGEKGPPRLTSGELNNFRKYSEEDLSQKADPGTDEFYEEINPDALKIITGDDEKGLNNLSAFEKELLGVSGAYGSPLLLNMLDRIILESNDSVNEDIINGLSSGPTNFAMYTNAFSTAKEAISSQIVYDKKENKDFSMIAAMIAGLIAYVITQSIVATMLAALLAFLFAISWIKYVDIDFTCMPWEPPTGGDFCNECNLVDTPCTEYRCESLGQLCKLENKGTSEELCLAMDANGTVPVIQPLYSYITEGFDYKNVNKNGFEIADKDAGECIPAFTTVKFGIKVEPFSRCRVSDDPMDTYKNMSDLFGFYGNKLLPAHKMHLFLVSPESLEREYNELITNGDSFLTEEQIKMNVSLQEEIKKLQEVKFYVKCQTADGKINPESYEIKSCVIPGPDLMAPEVFDYTEPAKGTYIKFNTTETDLKIYVDEPAKCKWSRSDESFDKMNNTFSCVTSIAKYDLYGLPCTTKITGIDKDNSNFYIRCQDLSENKNTMKQSFVYSISPSSSLLEITSVIPREGESFIEEVEPFGVTLKVKTAGGAQKGDSICKWSILNTLYSDQFKNTNASSHESVLDSVTEGDYNLLFECVDIAGNEANATTFFKARVDDNGPRITRIYYDGGLNVVTSEVATCAYDSDRRFMYENASEMTSRDGLEHTAPYTRGTYYVQCMDEYNNKGYKINVAQFISYGTLGLLNKFINKFGLNNKS